MNRRDFFNAAGLGTYSLIVLADSAAAQSSAQNTPPPPGARPDFERIAPSNAPFSRTEPKMHMVNLDADVLVAGGGLAGVCAAISAARHGSRVVLVQDRSRLGGVENDFFLQIGDERAAGVPEGDVERTREDGKASSVHFLRFPLTTAQIAVFRDPKTTIMIGCGHPAYSHLAGLSPATRAELSRDFA